MTAFLSNRFQRVIIDNVYSSYAPVISGPCFSYCL